MSSSPHASRIGARLPGIEAFRFIAIGAVILAHALPDLPHDNAALVLFRDLARCTVPFFFMVSGYFLPRHQPTATVALASFRRLAPLYFGWMAAYSLLWLAIEAHDGLTAADLRTLMEMVLSPGLTGGPAVHLWFLPALWIGIVAVLLFRHDLRLMALAAAVSFLLGLVLGGYSEALGLPRSPIWVARSGPLMGAPFVALGYLLARTGFDMRPGPAALVMTGGYLLFVVEQYLLSAGYTRWIFEDFLLGSAPFALGVFILARRCSGPVASRIAPLGRLTLWIYCVHLAFLYIAAELMHITPESGLAPRLALTLLVLAASTLSGLLAERIRAARAKPAPEPEPARGSGVEPG
ncbi:MAG: acyltransferase [Pseudochelatococcus sp.]|jgi:peptidoglycan/LPS O-acetylase OafA/YrhL|uniref:acyltransferase n=1 Tax=Pseudochelatococcus sp. TaxID=2020869 RepID=UPI003D8FAF47